MPIYTDMKLNGGRSLERAFSRSHLGNIITPDLFLPLCARSPSVIFNLAHKPHKNRSEPVHYAAHLASSSSSPYLSHSAHPVTPSRARRLEWKTRRTRAAQPCLAFSSASLFNRCPKNFDRNKFTFSRRCGSVSSFMASPFLIKRCARTPFIYSGMRVRALH